MSQAERLANSFNDFPRCKLNVILSSDMVTRVYTYGLFPYDQSGHRIKAIKGVPSD